MIGYLRTLPPVDREMPEPKVGPVARALYLRGNFPLLPAALIEHDATRPPLPPSPPPYLRCSPATRAMSRPAVRVAPRITTPPTITTSGSSRIARSRPN